MFLAIDLLSSSVVNAEEKNKIANARENTYRHPICIVKYGIM